MLRRALCCLICLLALPALSFAETTYTMAGFDGEDSAHDWATNGFFTRMQERTGIVFTFQQYVNYDEWQKAKTQMLTGGELPDVLFKAALTTRELNEYTDSGVLIDLKPLLEQNAPNLWALLSEHPDWMAAVTLPNGKIGALPMLQTQPVEDALWINREWLDKLKLDMPTDFASLREVLTAFVNDDPNGNGKRDEQGLLFLGPWELKLFSHAYGVVANDYNLYENDAGTVCYWPLEASFTALASTLRDLYAQGLLAQDGFNTADTLRRVTDKDATVTYGAFFAPTPVALLPFEACEAYEVVEPFVYEGKQVYRDLQLGATRGAFAITSACDDPAALLRWVDTLYTPEGAALAMVGEEGDAYIEKQNGLWDWKGGVDSLTAETLAKLSIYDTGEMPWLFPQAFYERYDNDTVRGVCAELHKLDPFLRSPFPVYSLTNAQSDELLPLQNGLGLYVDETLAKWVLGREEITEKTITAFHDGLRERGADRLIAIFQEIADAR